MLGAAVLWGTTGTARALGPDTAAPETVGAVRLIIGGSVLVVIALARGVRLRRRWPATPLAVAAVAVAAYQPLFFGGVGRAGVAVGTVVGIGGAPVIGGLLGRLVRGEPLGRRWLVATTLGLAGAAVLGVAGDEANGPAVEATGRLAGGELGVGLALAAGAGAAYAIYVTATKALLDDHNIEPAAASAATFAVAAVLLVPVAVLGGIGWLGTGRGAVVALHLGLVTVALAYPIFARGLARVGVGTASTLTLAEPATAAVLGVVVLGERPGAGAAVGLALVVAGLTALMAPRPAVRPTHTQVPG